MNILVTLFPLDTSASDGSVIPLSSISEYLLSDSYKENVVKKHLSVLGITHKDRKKNNSDLRIGEDDTILMNKNNVGYISRIYTQNDGFAWAEVTILDANLFEGSMREDILYVTGLISSGMRPPISAVIDAFWDGNEVAQKINSIDGLDITLNPGFVGAEIKSILD